MKGQHAEACDAAAAKASSKQAGTRAQQHYAHLSSCMRTLFHCAIISTLHIWHRRLSNSGVCIGLHARNEQGGMLASKGFAYAERALRLQSIKLPSTSPTSFVIIDRRRARVLPACVPGAAIACACCFGGAPSPAVGSSGCSSMSSVHA